MKIRDLAPNPQNPRKISDGKLSALKKALAEFGDLSGIVYNRQSGQIVGGHQRAKVLSGDADIVVEKKFKRPTAVGTVAEGYVLVNGERFSYREVMWDDIKEKAANIAANKGAGDWDKDHLLAWMQEIDDFGFDKSLTMFDEKDMDFFAEPKKRKVEFEVGDKEPGQTEYLIVLECTGEAQQEKLYAEFQKRGLACKIM